MNIKLNPMPSSPHEAVHQAADIMSWMGFTNYVNHEHTCTINVFGLEELPVVVDYANSQVVVIGFMDRVEI